MNIKSVVKTIPHSILISPLHPHTRSHTDPQAIKDWTDAGHHPDDAKDEVGFWLVSVRVGVSARARARSGQVLALADDGRHWL